MLKKGLGLGLLLLVTFFASAQIREIPRVVMETFTSQYPTASNTTFNDQLLKVDVRFELKDGKYLATYTNKGLWKGTEKDWNYDSLSHDVQLGYEKSKYADWTVEETKWLYLPGGTEQIRIRVGNGDFKKRYLFFSTKGQLLRDSFTL